MGAVNTKNDHLIFDGLEPITVEIRSVDVEFSGGTGTTNLQQINVENCLRREVELRQVLETARGDSQGRLIVGDVFWELWVCELPVGFVPERGMFIIPDNTNTEKWEILGVDYSHVSQKYRCHSRK